MRLLVYDMLVNVNVIYYVHLCEQARWARSAGNRAIYLKKCIIIIIVGIAWTLLSSFRTRGIAAYFVAGDIIIMSTFTAYFVAGDIIIMSTFTAYFVAGDIIIMSTFTEYFVAGDIIISTFTAHIVAGDNTWRVLRQYCRPSAHICRNNCMCQQWGGGGGGQTDKQTHTQTDRAGQIFGNCNIWRYDKVFNFILR